MFNKTLNMFHLCALKGSLPKRDNFMAFVSWCIRDFRYCKVEQDFLLLYLFSFFLFFFSVSFMQNIFVIFNLTIFFFISKPFLCVTDLEYGLISISLCYILVFDRNIFRMKTEQSSRINKNVLKHQGPIQGKYYI